MDNLVRALATQVAEEARIICVNHGLSVGFQMDHFVKPIRAVLEKMAEEKIEVPDQSGSTPLSPGVGPPPPLPLPGTAGGWGGHVFETLPPIDLHRPLSPDPPKEIFHNGDDPEVQRLTNQVEKALADLGRAVWQRRRES